MAIDKRHFVLSLRAHFEEQLGIARRAAVDAKEAAATLADEMEKREDGRAVIEFGSLSKGQTFRSMRAREELESLDHFAKQGVLKFDKKAAIGLGAMVDVSIDSDQGNEERTFFLMPVGAGTTLEGPGGDGFVSVITPASPVGKQLIGKRVGDSIDVTIKGDTYEWRIVDLF